MKDLRRLLYLLFGCALWGQPFSLPAQDAEFSQFYAAPVLMNPALTGAFDGRYRIGLAYRDQWRGLLEEKTTRFSAGVDFRFPVKYGIGRAEDGVGAGFFFTRDHYPQDFNINQFTLAGAYHKSLGKKNDQYLTLGFNLGLSQRSVRYDGLTFEDQFDGLNGYNNPSGEALPPNNIIYTDLATGLHYSFSPAPNKGFFAGLAYHHFNRPQVSFFFDGDADRSPGDDPLDPKLVAHVGGLLPLGELVQLQPRGAFFFQGNHWALNAGTNFRIPFNNFRPNAFYAGGWLRTVHDPFNELALDAAVALVGLEFNSFLMGFSYDLPLSRFSRDRLGNGSIEFSLRYIGKIENDDIFCPQF